MSTIVKVRNSKTGILYAYEQTAKWNPEKGQSRPVRKYLGRVVEETGEIIPSTGRRGRPKTKDVSPEVDSAQAYLNLKKHAEKLAQQLADCRKELSDVQAENQLLKQQMQEAARLSRNMADTFDKLIRKL